jgi:hypothetical protein
MKGVPDPVRVTEIEITIQILTCSALVGWSRMKVDQAFGISDK